MEIEIFGRKFYIFSDGIQWEKFNSMMSMYFFKPTSILVLICFVCCLIWIRKVRRKGKNRKLYKHLALLSYLLIIISLTILNRETGSVREIRWTYDPWFSGTGAFHESNIIVAVFNCLFFVPYGMLCGWQDWGDSNRFLPIIIVAVTGFMVELFQYILGRGVTSIGDITSFIIGGVTGVIIIKCLCRRQKQT
jgi:glycopeptide antibiotics resistance protein